MKYTPLLMIAALAILSPRPALAEVTVVPAGMKIVWQSLKDDFDGFQTYSSEEGVYVSVAVLGGDKNIIAFDKKKSKARFTYGDKDLGGEFGFWNKTSQDGKKMRIEVKTDQLPTGDAKQLKLSGSLNLVTAGKTETKTSGPSELKKGDKLTFGDDFTCEVSEIGKPKRGKDELEISLKWKENIPKLAVIRFYDEAGKLLESTAGGWSSMGGFGNKSITKSYLLKKKSDILKIEVDLWTDVENITVPLEINVNMTAGK